MDAASFFAAITGASLAISFTIMATIAILVVGIIAKEMLKIIGEDDKFN